MAGCGEIKKNNRLQSGDTLIEVIVAMLLMGTVILGLVPLYSYIRTHQLINVARLTAYNLAESQLGAIQSTPFEAMGTEVNENGSIVGDPPGSFLQQYPSITYPDSSGIVYNMSTQIRYEPDPSRSSSDPIKDDYKDITVEVKTQILGVEPALCPDIIVNSMATAENEWEELPGGNICVTAENATVPNTDPNYYVGNMTVQLSGPQEDSPITYQLLTDTASGDMPGEALFAVLPTTDSPYTYNMTASDDNNDGWMVRPIENSQNNIILSSANPNIFRYFHVAPACTLQLNFYHKNSPSDYSGTITLTDTLVLYSSTPNITITNQTSYAINNLWPEGNDLKAGDNDSSYLLSIPDAISIYYDNNGQPNQGQLFTNGSKLQFAPVSSGYKTITLDVNF